MEIYINARFLTQPVSGVQRYGIECSRQIKKRHPATQLLAPPDIFNKKVASELGAKVIGTNTGHKWEQIDLPFYLKKNGNPPLFNPSNTAPLFYNNTFLTLHDLAFYYHPEWNSRFFSMWYNFLLPRLAKRCKHMFTVSDTVKKEITKNYHVPESKISVTYNGLSSEMLAMGTDKHCVKEKIILSVGSFNIRKNHHNLINAFLKSRVKSIYKLVIVGDESKVFKESPFDESIFQNNNIEICEKFSDADLIAMYQKSEILVSLSVYEGFGIPLLEGLYYNCKVLCSDIPVYRELYRNNAHFCNPYNIEEIAEALNTVADNDVDEQVPINELLDKYNYEVSARKIIEEISSLGYTNGNRI